MTLNDFFKSVGYDIAVLESGFKSINKYLSWYKGFVESFHKYYIFNGEKKVNRKRYSLKLPKRLCENFADLLMNEKVQITLGTDEYTETINEILNANNFWVKANQGVEKAFALGIGSFLLSLDSRTQKIKIQFVNASNIYPLTYDSNGISECAFVSDTITFNRDTFKSEKIKNVQLHNLDEYGNYVIRNYRFVVSDDGGLTQVKVEDIPEEIQTGAPNRWFIPITPNITNNLDLDSPFGIPIYANSLDTLKAIDLTYDSFVNEIQNGRKRLFVTQEAMKVSSSNGNFQNAFDPQDVVFYLLEGNFNDVNSHYVQEVNGELRVEELRNAIQTHLDLLAIKLGLGEQYFKFEQNNATKTATEVISENSDLFRTIKKHEKVLESAITELILSIVAIGNAEHLFSISDPKITIDFDDSIIESKEQMRLQDRQDVAMDAMGLPEYRMKWFGEDEATAKAKIEEIKNQNTENESIKFVEGEID